MLGLNNKLFFLVMGIVVLSGCAMSTEGIFSSIMNSSNNIDQKTTIEEIKIEVNSNLKNIEYLENQNEEKLNEWMSQMDDIFPDVDEGDTLTGVATESRHSAFYFNGRLVGTIEDEDFTRHFFNIWLGEKTSEPEFRHALLNNNN